MITNSAKLNRLTLALGLAGIALSLHLWIQKERGFDQGCWGIAVPTTQINMEGCRVAELEQIGRLWGIALPIWGYLFYFCVTLLAIAKSVCSGEVARNCHRLGELLLAAGIPYTLYLSGYQLFVAKTVCVLCLTSTVLIFALTAIAVTVRLQGGYTPPLEKDRYHETSFVVLACFSFSGLIVALLLFVNSLGTRRFDEGTQAIQFENMLRRLLPKFIEVQKLQEMAPCRLDNAAPKLDIAKWIDENSPALGSATSGPVLLAFYDPNCPSCLHSFSTLGKLSKKYGDSIRIYALPRVLWDKSMLQAQALELAKQEGKYYEMWEAQFKRRRQEGLDLSDIRAILGELSISDENLEIRLSAYRSEVLLKRAMASGFSINSTPTLFLNGKKISGSNTSEACIARLIEQALAEHQISPQPKT